MSSYPPPPPPPGYGPPPGGPYGVYGPTRSTNGKAVAALICGIASLVTCFLPVGIAAVILGPQAKREIQAQPDRYDGMGLAQAGQILGWVAIGLMVAAILFFILAVVLAASSGDSTFESLGPPAAFAS